MPPRRYLHSSGESLCVQPGVSFSARPEGKSSFALFHRSSSDARDSVIDPGCGCCYVLKWPGISPRLSGASHHSFNPVVSAQAKQRLAQRFLRGYRLTKVHSYWETSAERSGSGLPSPHLHPILHRQRRQACSYLPEKIYAFRRPFLILFACPE